MGPLWAQISTPTPPLSIFQSSIQFSASALSRNRIINLMKLSSMPLRPLKRRAIKTHLFRDPTYHHLPDELLLLIFNHFAIVWEENLFPSIQEQERDDAPPDPEKLRTLCSLCRTCRRFRNVVQPLLYKTFVKPETIIGSVKNNAKAGVCAKYLPNMVLRHFLRTLIDRPDLAHLVRVVRINSFPSGYLLPFLEKYPFIHPEDDLLACYDRLPLFLWSPFTHWRETDLACHLDIRRGYEHAEIALLLALTRRVREVHIDLYGFTSGGLQYVLPSMVHLEVMTVRYKQMGQRTYKRDGPELLDAMLKHKSLHTLKIYSYESLSAPYSLFCKPRSSTLRTLHVRNFTGATSILRDMINACKCLHTLELTYDRNVDPANFIPWYILRDAILWHQRKTLISLTLEAYAYTCPHRYRESGQNRPLAWLWPFGHNNLRHFTALQHLRVHESLLLAAPQRRMGGPQHAIGPKLAQALPPNIITLDLLHPTRLANKELGELALVIAGDGKYPSLRTINVTPGRPCWRERVLAATVACRYQRAKPAKALEAAGIKLVRSKRD